MKQQKETHQVEIKTLVNFWQNTVKVLYIKQAVVAINNFAVSKMLQEENSLPKRKQFPTMRTYQSLESDDVFLCYNWKLCMSCCRTLAIKSTAKHLECHRYSWFIVLEIMPTTSWILDVSIYIGSVYGIFTYIYHKKSTKCRYTSTSPMDGMGYI